MKFHRSIIGFICGVLVAVTIGACAQKSHSSFTPMQVKDIQNIVHNYLVSKPEVLVEASQALRKKEFKKYEKASRAVVKKNADALFNSASAPVSGNKNGTVTLIEFFDYQCPHCIFMSQIIEAMIKANPNLRVVSMDFPIFGKISNYAAKAALAAVKQGKYWQLHNALFAAKKRLNIKLIDQIAAKTGLNMKQLHKDMKAAWITKHLKAVRKLAGTLRLQGTPAFVVGPTNYKSASPSKFSFFPGQTTAKVLQKYINQAG